MNRKYIYIMSCEIMEQLLGWEERKTRTPACQGDAVPT